MEVQSGSVREGLTQMPAVVNDIPERLQGPSIDHASPDHAESGDATFGTVVTSDVTPEAIPARKSSDSGFFENVSLSDNASFTTALTTNQTEHPRSESEASTPTSASSASTVSSATSTGSIHRPINADSPVAGEDGTAREACGKTSLLNVHCLSD